MQKTFFITALLFSVLGLFAQTDINIIQSNGLFFTDKTQTKLYNGEYKEYFDNKSLKVEMFIKDGKPEGAYIIYFPNGRPNEVQIGRASCRERV